MRAQRPPDATRDRASSREEGSLIDAEFVGSYPTADFKLSLNLPEVAFVGRSNVGKSSLLNSIVRRKALARTSKHPGKTRDCVVFLVESRLHLLDLPGYGYARVSRGERGRFARLIEGILAGRPQLAGVVWLLDIRRDPSDEDILLGQKLLAHETPMLVALTKADKLSKSQRARRVNIIRDALSLPADQIIVTSSVTKEGIETLRETVLAVAHVS